MNRNLKVWKSRPSTKVVLENYYTWCLGHSKRLTMWVMNDQDSCKAELYRWTSKPWNEQWNTVWLKEKEDWSWNQSIAGTVNLNLNCASRTVWFGLWKGSGNNKECQWYQYILVWCTHHSAEYNLKNVSLSVTNCSYQYCAGYDDVHEDIAGVHWPEVGSSNGVAIGHSESSWLVNNWVWESELDTWEHGSIICKNWRN